MAPNLRRNAISMLKALVIGAIAARSIHAQETDVAMSLVSFADSLVQGIFENPNECISFWGISMSFDLVRAGTGQIEVTANQLCETLGLCLADELLWPDVASAITSMYDGSCSVTASDGTCRGNIPLVTVANSIWVDDNVTLQNDYEALIGEFVYKTDFDDNSFGSTVNSWVNQSTFGLVDSIIDDGPSDADMIAINSIYFKAPWENEFNEGLTTTDFFYQDAKQGKDSPASEVRFMHMLKEFPYSDELLKDHQVISLPYYSSSLSMVIVLPMSATANPVLSKDVLDVLPQLEMAKVALALPKFNFESTYRQNLKTELKAIGLEAPFDEQLGFCGISADTCLFVDEIIQKTSIAVDEEGTIAAAVTALLLMPTSIIIDPDPPVPILFQADHPFQFFIHDAESDVVLFQGRVGDPTPTDIAATGPRHNNGYWEEVFGEEPLVVSHFIDSDLGDKPNTTDPVGVEQDVDSTNGDTGDKPSDASDPEEDTEQDVVSPNGDMGDEPSDPEDDAPEAVGSPSDASGRSTKDATLAFLMTSFAFSATLLFF